VGCKLRPTDIEIEATECSTVAASLSGSEAQADWLASKALVLYSPTEPSELLQWQFIATMTAL